MGFLSGLHDFKSTDQQLGPSGHQEPTKGTPLLSSSRDRSSNIREEHLVVLDWPVPLMPLIVGN
ncbi:hypothetical protein HOLleu_11498 [Holothuria leucospilota]|uniref:Uncharacterized protein n=1 Tax=Holothuria leucospilota TaxID=206669 RepID=A0A9Q1CES8_HOLLE|nr:hypothetical protein HOLleu_11498 [Holothuria leucospilota]